jgi:orotidine-5'-phosphate decarboxylase
MSKLMGNTLMFADRLIELIQQKGTPCIIGLDPALKYMPSAFLQKLEISTDSSIEAQAEALYLYNLQVLNAVYDLVPAVKLQSAYYEVFGSQGIRALERIFNNWVANSTLTCLSRFPTWRFSA